MGLDPSGSSIQENACTIDVEPGTFDTEYSDASADYVRDLGRRPESIERIVSVMRDRIAPVYED